MKTLRTRLLTASMAWLTCLPLTPGLVAQDAGATTAPAADSLQGMLAASGGNWQMVLDTLLEQVKTTGDASAKEGRTAEVIGKEIDGLLSATEKAKAGDQPDVFYANTWKLLRVVPELATKTMATRAKIAGTSDAVKKFMKDIEGPLAKMTENYQRFREKLGIRSADVDQAAQKLGLKGAVDAVKGTPVEGDIALKADPAGAKPTVTDAEKDRIATLETAFKKLLAVDRKKIPDGYAALWMDVTKSLETAWYFQSLYKADAKIGEADPETLKFLRSLNHGMGDLSRYEPLAQQMGWDVKALDSAAGIASEDGTGLGNGVKPDQPGSTAAVAGGGAGGEAAQAGAATTTTTPANPATATAVPAAGGSGLTADSTAGGGTSAKNSADADDWQAKLDSQLKKDEPAAAPAATGTVTLDKSSQQLTTTIQKSSQAATTAKADRTAKGAKEFFKAQWQLLRTLPETGYKTPETRKAMEGENDEAKTFLKANEATSKALSELFIRFKQRLGLRSAKVEQMAKRMGVKGNVDETKGASNASGTGDISLDADPKAANANVTNTITANERYKMQVLETYLKRISLEEGRSDTANGENDFKEAMKVLEGAYFFQVLYKQNPAIGAQFPEILKFLQSINGGLGDLRAYQNLLERNGWTIDDNGDLVRGDAAAGGDAGGDAAGGDTPAPAPGPGFRGGGAGGAGPAGGGRGGRGGRGR